MLLPNFGQFSTHRSMFENKVIHKAYLYVEGLDHVCVDMDVDGKAIGASIYVPSLKMFFETRDKGKFPNEYQVR